MLRGPPGAGFCGGAIEGTGQGLSRGELGGPGALCIHVVGEEGGGQVNMDPSMHLWPWPLT